MLPALPPRLSVIICDCYYVHFRLLAGAIWKDVTRRTWIFSTSFSYKPSVVGPMVQGLLNGSLSLSVHSEVRPGFEDFLLELCLAMYPGHSLVREL